MSDAIKPGNVVVWPDRFYGHECGVVTSVTEKTVICGRRHLRVYDKPRRSPHTLERTQELLRAAHDRKRNAEMQIWQQYQARIDRILEGSNDD